MKKPLVNETFTTVVSGGNLDTSFTDPTKNNTVEQNVDRSKPESKSHLVGKLVADDDSKKLEETEKNNKKIFGDQLFKFTGKQAHNFNRIDLTNISQTIIKSMIKGYDKKGNIKLAKGVNWDVFSGFVGATASINQKNQYSDRVHADKLATWARQDKIRAEQKEEKERNKMEAENARKEKAKRKTIGLVAQGIGKIGSGFGEGWSIGRSLRRKYE